MKTIEEKARAYDEAIEKGKQIQNTPYIAHWDIMKEVAEHLLPELKESGDEKIRNWLIRTLKSLNSTAVQIDGAYEMMLPAIAWLERVAKPADKQGEQKPAVPKFRIGDKVKKGYLTYTVEDIDEDSYKLQAYSKDGDKGCTVFLSIGYEKDYELVEQNPADTEKGTNGNEREIPNSAWSEADVNRFNNLIYLVEQSNEGKGTKEGFVKFINRLKSLRPQNTWKPSEHELEVLRLAAEKDGTCLMGLYEQLKKLKA